MKVTVKMMAMDWHATNKAGETETPVIDWYNNTTQLPSVKSDAETRPINPFEGEGDDIPVGGVIPLGGADHHAPANTFPSYIRCDGDPIDRNQVPDLVNTVGTRFQLAAGTTSWCSPNLSAKFIRGVNFTGRNDPDSNARILRRAVRPRVLAQSDATCAMSQELHGGDMESRPVNAGVQYYINSVGARDIEGLPAVLPIGGIIAVPANQANNNTFNLPNLHCWVLRGADVNGAQDGGESDWNNRFSLYPGGATRGAGSYQRSATARPARLGIERLDHPVDTVTTTKTRGFPWGPDELTNKSAQANGPQTLALTAKWDDEIIPTTVVVAYYIRAV
ncbi:hypothetical protein N657DRAFT_671474 [Parathielavia appendiculata]|uniref:Tail fiber protein n=1 Tax=Parathielavia appendiculata TaxID=2587402 RepID=A0AAN6U1M7_9PEZI|nr:hypothetical protein N657DRAFT_671474 [Parathielavia appendiculata]